MDPVITVVSALVLTGFVIRLIYSSRSETRQRKLQAYSRQVGLAVVPEIVSELRKRIYRRERSAIFGAMAGLCVGAVLVAGMDGSRSPWSGLLLGIAVTVGTTMGLLVIDARAAFAPAAEEPRVARAVSPGLADYVTKLDRAFSLGLLTLATLGYIVVLGIIALNPERTFDEVSVRSILWPAGLLLALATVATLVTWAAVNALLARGQPASTYVELAWSDAFRSTTLRSLVYIPGIIAAVSTFIVFQSLNYALQQAMPDSVGEALAGSFIIMGPALLVILIVWTITSERNRSTTHYLRRLWPETASALDRGRLARGRGAVGRISAGPSANDPSTNGHSTNSHRADDSPGEDSRTKTPA